MLFKELIDKYLEELACEIGFKVGREARVKLVIVGGAAIALMYTFRESTMDIDAFYRCEGLLNSSIKVVGERYGIGSDWLNSNVTATTSFTTRIEKFIVPYKTFQGLLEVFTVDALTLICMKCVSCRLDSHDMEDIANLLDVHTEFTFEDIMNRFIYLFNDWSMMKMDAQMYLTDRFKSMPPDMVDFFKDMLPPSSVQGLDGKELYAVCNQMYQRLGYSA